MKADSPSLYQGSLNPFSETFISPFQLLEAMTFNPIKSIAEKKITEEVHNAFTRYSIGEFVKELFIIKVSGKGIVIKAGFEYLNFLHRFLAANSSGEVEVEGVMESVRSLSPVLAQWKLEAEEKKRFGKTGNKYVFPPQVLSAAAYKELVQELFTEYLLFNAAGTMGRLKVKNHTTPKLGSPTEDFITLKLDASLLPAVCREFLFDLDIKKFSTATLQHTYRIQSIEINEKLLEKDAALARKQALRKGELLRKITIDGTVAKEYAIKFSA